MRHFDRINFSSQCLHFRLEISMVTLARTRDFAILQSKKQTWQTYGAGECRVFDDNERQENKSFSFPINNDKHLEISSMTSGIKLSTW